MKMLAYTSVFALCVATAPHAATFDFDFVYDGMTLAVAAGSDPVDGTQIEVGDSFVLSIVAAIGGFWTAGANSFNQAFLAAFNTAESADRVADITTTLSLDGATVFQTEETDVVGSYVHIGSQVTSVPVGTIFDSWVVEYTLTDIFPAVFDEFGQPQPDPDGSGLSTLVGNGLIFGGFVERKVMGENVFVYTDPTMSAVPLPAGLPLLALGVVAVGLAGAKRRNRS